MFDLQGKRAVVTGAASGIGLAIAEIFAAHKAEVILLDLDPEKATAAAQAIATKSSANVSGVGCDVSSAESVAEAFAKLDGTIDILVNCVTMDSNVLENDEVRESDSSTMSATCCLEI